MNSYFNALGGRLIDNGYQIIPIKPGTKSPSLREWSKTKIGKSDLKNWPNHGIGIITGQGEVPVIGIDIDVSNVAICEALIEWCDRNIGKAPRRVGNAPRVMLMFRAQHAGMPKRNSAKFIDPNQPVNSKGEPLVQVIEVLGKGQQFVAYHIHPVTKRPYEWTLGSGSPEGIAASDLAIVSVTQLEALFEAFERLALGNGLQKLKHASNSARPQCEANDEDDLLFLAPPCDLDKATVLQTLGFLNNTPGVDYDEWLKVGMALHHQSMGEQWGLEAWNEWSAKSPKFDPNTGLQKWRSFGKSDGNVVTFATVLAMTKKAREVFEIDEKRQSLDELKAKVNMAEDAFSLLGPIAGSLREAASSSIVIENELATTIQRKYYELTNSKIRIEDVRKALRYNPSPTVLEKRPLTEFGNCDRFFDDVKSDLMFVPEYNSWFRWHNYYWRSTSEQEIACLAQKTIRNLVYERNLHIDSDEFYGFCQDSQSARMVRSIVQLASSNSRALVNAEELDKHSHLLGVTNGTVDLRNGNLIPPDPSHRITMSTHVAYIPSAECPQFIKTLEEVFLNNSEQIDFFLQLMGYALLGKPDQNWMMIAFGKGSNGKTTLLGTIQAVFGDYAVSASAATLVSDGGAASAGGAREDLTRLKGIRFIYVNETDEGELREAVVKSMTGGDIITARAPYAKSSIQIKPTWFIVMPTNHKPIIKGDDHGIWRRLLPFPFARNFDKDPTIIKDPDRSRKLLTEKEGILALLVRYAQKYLECGIKLPLSIQRERDVYRDEMDVMGEWIETQCEVGEGHSSRMSELWDSWRQFAEPRGIIRYVSTSAALGRRLDTMFPAKRGTGGVRMRSGIRVKHLGWDGSDGSDDIEHFFS